MRSLLLLALASALALPVAAQGPSSGLDASAMDPSVRPQDDLFRAVNGSWLETVEIPADRSRYGSFDILREASEENVRAIIEAAAASPQVDPDARKIGEYYTAYMDTDRIEALGITPLQPDVDRIDAVQTKADLIRYFAQNSSTFGPSPIGSYVWVDDKNSDRHVFFLSQSGTSLPDRSYYLDDNFAEARAGYLAYLERIYELAGWPNGAEAAQTVLDLETQLAMVQWTRVQNRDPEATYNPTALSDLMAAHPNLHLDVFMDEIGLAGEVDTAYVNQPPFFASLDSLVAALPLADWTTYARARTLSSATGLLPKAFGEANFDFFGRQLSGQEEDRPRWKKAVSATSGVLGEAIGRIYVDRHYPKEAADRMESLILNLQEAFRQSIRENPWMTDATKAEALDKLENYTFKIGYPEKWTDYSTLQVSSDDLIGNVRSSSARGRAENLELLGKSPDRSRWGMTPQTVNAYYSAAFNEIVFPAAILQPPFFNVEADDAVNYGGIGAVIGHEFSHGFDDSGSQYDAEGNLRNWWSEEDRTQFEARADRLVAQYDGYAPFEDANVNGRLTLGENIGDLSGLTMAYRAYRLSLDTNGDGTISASEEAPVIDGLTGDQRFFMGWAQVWRITHREPLLRQLLKVDSHSPGEYRANGPLAHIPAFYDAFDVQPGDGLYLAPEDRIVLW